MNEIFSNYTMEEWNLLAAAVDTIRISRNDHQQRVSEFADEYLRYSNSYHAKKYSQSIKLSFDHLISFLAKDYLLGEITINLVTEFLDNTKLSAPKGYRVYYRNLKAAFNKAVEWEYIKANPFAKVKLPKNQKSSPAFVTRNELNHIVKFITNKVIYIIVLFSFLTGCRLSETVNLQFSDINFQRKLITVGNDFFETKTREQRIIPICDELFKILKEYQENINHQTGFVFTKINGFPYSPEYVSKQFKKAVRLAGFDDSIHFHSIRHSFASNLVQNDVPIYTVQKLLGHSSVTTTEIYSHLNTSELEKAINKFNQI